VTFISLNSPAFRQPILSTIGSQLESLEFNNCPDIDMKSDVLPCCKLESLIIAGQQSNMLMEPYSLPTDCDPPSSSLPCLKKLKVEICLGQFSALFQSERSLLTDVSLRCLHFGIVRIAGSAGWDDLPKMWPNLEVLSASSDGVSLNNLPNFAPQFKSLKRITIKRDKPIFSKSYSLEQNERYTAAAFELKNPGINLVFETVSIMSGMNCCCSLIQQSTYIIRGRTFLILIQPRLLFI
jgi:hypothetical protein